MALGEAGFGGGQERPILENSTACTMSNAKTRLCFSVSSYFGVVLGVQRIPLEID